MTLHNHILYANAGQLQQGVVSYSLGYSVQAPQNSEKNKPMISKNPTETLPDVQSFRDDRRIAINKVGVTEVSFPVQVASHFKVEAGTQPSVATMDMFVSLPSDQKGTHMSRFMQLLRDWDQPLEPSSIIGLCEAIRERLQAADAFLKLRFPYFVERLAPVTQESGVLRIDAEFEVSRGNENDLVMTLKGPATSLCPCSKQISDRGAHNQRCELTVSVRCPEGEMISIEDLFGIMEGAASTQVFPVLKRPDEKHVTEDAYDHPKFVEDIVRDLADGLAGDDRIVWYRCSSENFESIHQHNAFALIES